MRPAVAPDARWKSEIRQGPPSGDQTAAARPRRQRGRIGSICSASVDGVQDRPRSEARLHRVNGTRPSCRPARRRDGRSQSQIGSDATWRPRAIRAGPRQTPYCSDPSPGRKHELAAVRSRHARSGRASVRRTPVLPQSTSRLTMPSMSMTGCTRRSGDLRRISAIRRPVRRPVIGPVPSIWPAQGAGVRSVGVGDRDQMVGSPAAPAGATRSRAIFVPSAREARSSRSRV